MVRSRSISCVFYWLGSIVLAGLLGYYVGARSSWSGAPATSPSEAKLNLDGSPSAALARSRRLASAPPEIATTNDETRPRSTASPRTPKTERELAASLESMAAKDHDRAMALALGQPNLRLRELLRNAVLRGWASVASDAALAFAMHLSETDNRPAIGAVLAGAAQNPDNAVRLARLLTADDAPLAKEYGVMAVTALSEAGEYETAARFAASGPPNTRDEWLNEAFTRWAEHDPEAALHALDGITQPDVRRDALQGLINGWAEANPVGLAEYALGLPSGGDRALALARALPNWVTRDPVAASEWLNNRDPDPNLDVGVSAVATMPNLVGHRPEVAVEWAQSVTDPTMRAGALRSIAEQWSRAAPVEFRRWLEQNPDLAAPDRQALVEGATPTPATGGTP